VHKSRYPPKCCQSTVISLARPVVIDHSRVVNRNKLPRRAHRSFSRSFQAITVNAALILQHDQTWTSQCSPDGYSVPVVHLWRTRSYIINISQPSSLARFCFRTEIFKEPNKQSLKMNTGAEKGSTASPRKALCSALERRYRGTRGTQASFTSSRIALERRHYFPLAVLARISHKILVRDTASGEAARESRYYDSSDRSAPLLPFPAS